MTNGVILRRKTTKNLKFIFLNATLNRTQIYPQMDDVGVQHLKPLHYKQSVFSAFIRVQKVII